MIRRAWSGIRRAARWVSKPFRREPPNPDLLRLNELKKARSARAEQLRKTLGLLRKVVYTLSPKNEPLKLAEVRAEFSKAKAAGEREIAGLNAQIGALEKQLGLAPQKVIKKKTKKK